MRFLSYKAQRNNEAVLILFNQKVIRRSTFYVEICDIRLSN